jgi:putative CocE/NonD family hydrolase
VLGSPTALVLVALTLVAPMAAFEPTTATTLGMTEHKGYVTVRDGTQLAYDLKLPGDGSGRYPLLFTYDGYDAGSNADPAYAAEYLPKGYALLGVNVRGTGCSGGTFDFFAPVQGFDGYDVIQWAAGQPWSDGNVGMIGKSYPGITQLFVAATQPPHLKAIAPGHVYGDIYRDVAYPGGIFNYAFAGLWSFVAQPEPGYAAALQSQDPQCDQNVLQHTATNAPYNAFLQAQEHPFDDALIKERSPYYVADRIQVPTFLFQSWQDEQVGVRGVDVVEKLHAPYWLTLSNGDHGMYRTPTDLARLERFFDHFLKGADNGWESEPRVLVWWDARTDTRAPSWTTSYDAWPVTNVSPATFWLDAGGALSTTAPTAASELPDAYAYPTGTTSNGAGYGETCPTASLCDPQWPATNLTRATPAPTRVTYESAPLADDLVVLGAGNFTFWAASTAADTDFQVTLSEVRPDGKDVFVQNGWLRASHRDLDGARSSEYRPFQSHTQLDPLTPGTPTEMSLEIFPVGQVFHQGSRLRVDIEAPTTTPQLWGFAALPVPSLDLVYHDANHPSRLVLPTLPGEHPLSPLPACGVLIRQSCV